jgi:hypothetical protein
MGQAIGNAASSVGRKALATLVLIAAAYLLFKVVIGFVMGIVWVIIAVVAIAGVIWALSALKVL